MKKLLTGITLIIGANLSYADEFQPKFFGGLEAGYTKVSDSTGTVATGLVSALGGSATVTQNSYMGDLRIFGGYKLTENIDFELGYLQSSDVTMKFSGTTGSTYSNTAYSGSFVSKLSGYDYGILLRPSIASGFNDVFFKIGGHRIDQKITGSVTVSSTTVAYSDTNKGNGTLYGLGYDSKIASDLHIRTSLTRYAKIAGDSDTYGTIFSVGLTKAF